MFTEGWRCSLSSFSNSNTSSQLILVPFSPNTQKISTLQSQRVRSTRQGMSSLCVVSSSVGFNDILDIAHNKVLIAASVSAAIGQFSKPFTSRIFYGKRKEFDISIAFQSGGFPSTHSSAVVATATTLGLERGFSDAIFGLAVVYASLVMYDAQGVRREVGIHAKALNKIIAHQNSFAPNGNTRTQPTKTYSNSESSFGIRVSNLEAKTLTSDVKMGSKLVLESENTEAQEFEDSGKKLKESVGHSEIEVIAGAFLGFFVSLVLYTIT